MSPKGASTGFKYDNNVYTISYQTAYNSPENKKKYADQNQAIPDHTVEATSKNASPNTTRIRFVDQMNLSQQSVRYQTQRFKTDNYNDNNNDLIQHYESLNKQYNPVAPSLSINKAKIPKVQNVKNVQINFNSKPRTKMLNSPSNLPEEIARQLQYYEQAMKEGKAFKTIQYQEGARSSLERQHLHEQKEQQFRF